MTDTSPSAAARIEIRGRGSANVLDAECLVDLVDQLDAAEGGPASSALVYGPAGWFAAGADLTYLETLTGHGAHAFARAGSRLFRRLRRTRLWTLAAVDGHCIRASIRHAPVERSAARLAWGLPPCAP